MNLTIQNDSRKKPLKAQIMRSLKQLTCFGWEQALSCLFPVAIFASLAITQFQLHFSSNAYK
ncbi:hypothetical protein GCM10011409_34900 [Lentibacillus populi]|uniref:Uncharacterized protein n=1 Tax=Lentibacillus populi TaxID=1827502 RepID=A0A9W5U054_9BACI|nr:hypothetical protein GCM10011409_34900 [Lentibacillus populi]